MTALLRGGVAAIALAAGIGVVMAQQQPAPSTAVPETSGNARSSSDNVAKPQTAPEQGEPESTPGHSQTNAGLPTGQTDNAVFKNGVLNAPGAPKDSQTTPAKFSERNAALDNTPTMAMPLDLTDEQKQQIYATLSAGQAAPANIEANPADILPSTVVLRDLPKEIAAEIPAVRDLKYVKLQDKIVLVRAPNRIVVAEIGK
jgi:hypothetical protein